MNDSAETQRNKALSAPYDGDILYELAVADRNNERDVIPVLILTQIVRQLDRIEKALKNSSHGDMEVGEWERQ